MRFVWLFVLVCVLVSIAVNAPAAMAFAILAWEWRRLGVRSPGTLLMSRERSSAR